MTALLLALCASMARAEDPSEITNDTELRIYDVSDIAFGLNDELHQQLKERVRLITDEDVSALLIGMLRENLGPRNLGGTSIEQRGGTRLVVLSVPAIHNKIDSILTALRLRLKQPGRQL